MCPLFALSFVHAPHLIHLVVAERGFFFFFPPLLSLFTFLILALRSARQCTRRPARLSLHSSPPTLSVVVVVVALLDDDATYAVCAHPASTAPYDTTVPTRDTTLATRSRRLKSSMQGRKHVNQHSHFVRVEFAFSQLLNH